MLLKLEKKIDTFSDYIGYIAASLTFILLFNVFYDAIMRYFFRSGSIAFQEMEWHLFSLVFLLGISYALKENGHVRVDFIYDRLSQKKKAVIDILGTLLLLLPLSILIINGSTWFVMEAYNIGEISGDPGGLPYRFLIKGAIPVSFVFLLISATGFILRNINIYRGCEEAKEDKSHDNIL